MDKKDIIISKVNRSRKGTIFLPESFLPVDTRYASNVLANLAESGKITRVAFGIYIKPKMSSFGPVMPTMEQIARTIAQRDCADILPAGATAENYLGFSTQVPMNSVYLTSGTPRKIKVGKRALILKRSVPSTFAYKGRMTAILVLALKSIGQKNVDEEVLSTVYGILKKYPEDKTWLEDMALVPHWIRKIITVTKDRIKQNEQMD